MMAQQGQQGQQGQQKQQSPSGSGQQFTDQDIFQVVLNENKHIAESLNSYVLEAADEQLRRDYMTVLGDVYSQQKQLFDVMQQKGYYTVKNANPQDVAQAKSKFSSNSSM
ncbi:MAG TPA: spore coat protein [Negativicutes bacterium]|jgi:spore coat protein CotF